jgi:hypothetical protein
MWKEKLFPQSNHEDLIRNFAFRFDVVHYLNELSFNVISVNHLSEVFDCKLPLWEVLLFPNIMIHFPTLSTIIYLIPRNTRLKFRSFNKNSTLVLQIFASMRSPSIYFQRHLTSMLKMLSYSNSDLRNEFFNVGLLICLNTVYLIISFQCWMTKRHRCEVSLEMYRFSKQKFVSRNCNTWLDDGSLKSCLPVAAY